MRHTLVLLLLLCCSLSWGQGLGGKAGRGGKGGFGGGPSAGGGTVALVNTSVIGNTGSGVAGTITSTTNGNRLGIIIQSNNATETVTSVCNGTGTGGCTGTDTFTAVRSPNTTLVNCQGVMADIWTGSVSGGKTTLNVTMTGGHSYLAVVYEMSGATTGVDQANTLTSSGTNMSGPSLTITSASELIIESGIPQLSVSAIFGGNAFTNDSIQNGSGWAHLITVATGSYNAQWTSTGAGANCSNGASFKP